jgi:hypothetical protein
MEVGGVVGILCLLIGCAAATACRQRHGQRFLRDVQLLEQAEKRASIELRCSRGLSAAAATAGGLELRGAVGGSGSGGGGGGAAGRSNRRQSSQQEFLDSGVSAAVQAQGAMQSAMLSDRLQPGETVFYQHQGQGFIPVKVVSALEDWVSYLIGGHAALGFGKGPDGRNGPMQHQVLRRKLFRTQPEWTATGYWAETDTRHDAAV